MLELINSILMLQKQTDSRFVSDEEKARTSKVILTRLESLSLKVNWEIMEANNKLKKFKNENLPTN